MIPRLLRATVRRYSLLRSRGYQRGIAKRVELGIASAGLMPKTRPPARFKSGFTFGGPVAERDPLLVAAFYDNGDYSAIEDFGDPRNFIIGRTGSGKSAIVRYLEKEHPGKVARIVPEDLSLPYVANLPAVRHLRSLGVHLDIFFRALWKHVILVEVIRHRYRVTTPEGKASLLVSLREKFNRDPAKREALEYLNEFGEKFWCQADERIHEIAEKFEQRVEASAKGGSERLGLALQAGGESLESVEVRRELQERYQLVVNETQPARLNRMIRILGEEILDSPHHQTYVVIDDLDRDWVDEGIANELIRCLFHAVVDMQSVEHLKVLVALRTNIFRQLLTDGRGRGGQEEKLRALAYEVKWTRGDLVSLLDRRAQAALAHHQLPERSLIDMLPAGPKDRKPIDFILDHTLMRPRDAIVYLNYAARASTGKSRIAWSALNSVDLEYSQDRLEALRDEWKDPYAGLDQVFELYRSSPPRLKRSELSKRLDDAALLSLNEEFPGKAWLSGLVEELLEGADGATWFERYNRLLKLLYGIGFLGFGNDKQRRVIFNYEDPQWCDHEDNLAEESFAEVHPAFRAALSIRTPWEFS